MLVCDYEIRFTLRGRTTVLLVIWYGVMRLSRNAAGIDGGSAVAQWVVVMDEMAHLVWKH